MVNCRSTVERNTIVRESVKGTGGCEERVVAAVLCNGFFCVAQPDDEGKSAGRVRAKKVKVWLRARECGERSGRKRKSTAKVRINRNLKRLLESNTSGRVRRNGNHSNSNRFKWFAFAVAK